MIWPSAHHGNMTGLQFTTSSTKAGSYHVANDRDVPSTGPDMRSMRRLEFDRCSGCEMGTQPSSRFPSQLRPETEPLLSSTLSSGNVAFAACATIGSQDSEGGADMSTGTILLVDDEPKVCDLLRAYLERSGYEVACVQQGTAALEQVARRTPDLVLLDLNLPGIDGLEVCKTLRKTSDVPIIMLTARDEEADRIVGLELGADDYVTKPFSPREVVARVKAVLRRRDVSSSDTKPLEVGALSVDAPRHQVHYRGQVLPLTSREFAIVEYLARNPGRVYSRTQLLDQVFGIDFEGYDRTIDAHIKNIRQKMQESAPGQSTPLVTVRGVGYKLQPDEDA
jgi:two-component system alkaline phosphatase synthesis response regulator PhoP